jgi:hypothetical protein
VNGVGAACGHAYDQVVTATNTEPLGGGVCHYGNPAYAWRANIHHTDGNRHSMIGQASNTNC